MAEMISIDDLIERMIKERITYSIEKSSLGEQFKICLPMKNNFTNKLDVFIVLYETGDLEYKAQAPISIKDGIELIGLKVANEMNLHDQITCYYLEDESVIKARYKIKTNEVLELSSDYILSMAFHFAKTVDESLCRIFSNYKVY